MTRFPRASSLAVVGMVASLALTGCAGSPTPAGSDQASQSGAASGARPVEETGDVTIKFVWWGNDTRNQLTQQVLDKFMAAYPNITVETETSDFASYFQMVSTSIAGGKTPDVIQMDEKYIASYGLDDNLLDLESVDIDLGKFDQSAIDAGRVEGTLFGATFGINVPVMLANPSVFDKAGVKAPDDASWTWEDFASIAEQIGAKGGTDYYGASTGIGADGVLKVWLREHDKSQFTADGIGFTAQDVAPFYQYWLDLQNAGGTPPATVNVEEGTKALNQSLFATNRSGMTFQWSNQVTALDKATGQDLTLLRPPTVTGEAADANLWLKSSMYLSVSKETEHPDAALKLVEFLLNDPEAGAILGTERGIPANSEIRSAVEANMNASDQKVVSFIDEITAELGDASVVPLPGGGQSESIQKQYAEAVMLGTTTPDDGAADFVDDLKAEMDLS